MENRNALEAVLTIVGEKLIDLESDLSYHRAMGESYKKRIAELEAEVLAKNIQLTNVQEYIDRMEKGQNDGEH